jgi:hypothetical protein
LQFDRHLPRKHQVASEEALYLVLFEATIRGPPLGRLVFQPNSVTKPAVNDLPLFANRTEIEKVGPVIL